MARTQQEYADEYYLKGKAQAEERYKQRQANDEKQIQTMTNTVQKATEAQVQPYQTQMEELPDQYRELHDANALAELVGQRQVKEAMANMGLSDSGLNRTQMTALAVQRGNADADLRRDRQRRTQELQDRIAHIRNTGQLEIEQQTAAIRGETDNWYNTALDTVYTNAQALGASAYAADQKVEAEKLAAQRAADELAVEKAKARQKELDWQQAVLANRGAYGYGAGTAGSGAAAVSRQPAWLQGETSTHYASKGAYQRNKKQPQYAKYATYEEYLAATLPDDNDYKRALYETLQTEMNYDSGWEESVMETLNNARADKGGRLSNADIAEMMNLLGIGRA